MQLNITMPEAFARAGAGLMLPVLIVWFRSSASVIVICIVATYMLITAMLLFCPVKSLVQHVLFRKKHQTKDERDVPVKEL